MSYSMYSDRHPVAEDALRDELVRIGALLHARNYVTATDGNISARLGEDRFLVTPTGLSKGFMTPDQMVVIDPDGRAVDAGQRSGPTYRPSSEILLHLEAYRQRPDVRGVIHAHPPIAVALSIADIPIAPCVLPEIIVLLGMIPTAPYATPSSAEDAAVLRKYVGRYDAVVLQRHGSVTVGSSLMDAYLNLEKLEHAADITFKLVQLGRELPFDPAAVAKLLDMRERMGLMLPGQRAEIEKLCANYRGASHRFIER